MTIKSMVFKKCYLLAVMMAANIFVVNEVKAMNSPSENELENNEYKIKKTNLSLFTKKTGKVCEWENTINFTVGSALSLANNYFKWWDYNKGGYWKLGCLGWRSERFLKDCFQFDVNLNIGRGILWTVANFLSFNSCNTKTCCIVTRLLQGHFALAAFLILALLQGSLSMPIVIHISTFDFTIALDSLIWVGVDRLSVKYSTKQQEENVDKPIELN